MRIYSIGDIVIAEFPFTDKEEKKLRPFIVVAKVGAFLWGIMLTSSVKFYNDHTYELNSSDVDFELKNRTIARCDIIQTIDMKICKFTIGKLNDECRERIIDIVFKTLGNIK